MVDREPLGWIFFKLFVDTAPKIVGNFPTLSIGREDLVTRGSPSTESRQDLHARMVSSHPIEKIFENENFILKCAGPGILAMINARPNTNSSQVFITLPGLNGWMANIAFGKVRRRFERCVSHGVLWVQGWQDPKESHCCWLWTRLALVTCVHLYHQSMPSRT